MKLQTYREYIVDYRLRQFRSQPANFGVIDFIDFKSERGDALLTEMLENGLVPHEYLAYCI